MRIYITHCSAKKDESVRVSGSEVTPDALYTAAPTQRFIRTCREKGVEWAIFSDLYGVWFPSAKHKWYEKDPRTVTDREFSALLRNFDEQLEAYDEICFYLNPGRFHPLYRRLLAESTLKDRITCITHIRDIT